MKKKNRKLYGGPGWALNTMKFTFNMYDMFPTGLFSSQKKIEIEDQKFLNDYCSTAHLQYRKYLLSYICYIFGAAFANCNSNKVKFIMNEEFLLDQLNNFFNHVKKRYKNPKKNDDMYLPFLDSLPLKRNVNLNKNFFYAHLTNLKKKHLLLIVRWFLDNWKKNTSIEKVFYGAAHYMSLEHDPILRDKRFNQYISNAKSRKTTEAQRNTAVKKVWMQICPSKFSKFKKSGLNKNIPLRMSYWYLIDNFNDEINRCYLSSKYKDKFIEDIITKGSNLMPYTGRFLIEEMNKANALADIERDTVPEHLDLSEIPISFFWKMIEANFGSSKNKE